VGILFCEATGLDLHQNLASWRCHILTQICVTVNGCQHDPVEARLTRIRGNLSGMDRVTAAIRKAFDANGMSVRQLSKELGEHYTTVHRYMRGDGTPPADFVRRVATVIGQPIGEIFGRDELLHSVLGAESDEERQAVDELDLPGMTPTEEMMYREKLARWIKADPCEFPERLERAEKLAAYLVPPFGKLDTRELTDYREAILLALGLAMPPRRK
jgi:transcriptional regulator with XRE-family HTH domain